MLDGWLGLVEGAKSIEMSVNFAIIKFLLLFPSRPIQAFRNYSIKGGMHRLGKIE